MWAFYEDVHLTVQEVKWTGWEEHLPFPVANNFSVLDIALT